MSCSNAGRTKYGVRPTIVISDCRKEVLHTILYIGFIQEFVQPLVEECSRLFLILLRRYVHIADTGCLESARSIGYSAIAGETRAAPMKIL